MHVDAFRNVTINRDEKAMIRIRFVATEDFLAQGIQARAEIERLRAQLTPRDLHMDKDGKIEIMGDLRRYYSVEIVSEGEWTCTGGNGRDLKLTRYAARLTRARG